MPRVGYDEANNAGYGSFPSILGVRKVQKIGPKLDTQFATKFLSSKGTFDGYARLFAPLPNGMHTGEICHSTPRAQPACFIGESRACGFRQLICAKRFKFLGGVVFAIFSSLFFNFPHSSLILFIFGAFESANSPRFSN